MNSLGSYFITFETLAEELVKAGDVFERVEKIYRSWFNEFYERKIDTVDASDVLLLGNGIPKWEVPEDTVRIYMGIDTQKDCFWWEIKAYCYEMLESHSIAHGRAESFSDLERIWEIGQNIVSKHGEVLRIDKLGIDRRGYNQGEDRRTDEVDQWVRKMSQLWRVGDENRIYATEGEPTLRGNVPFSIATRKDTTDNRIKVDIKVMKLSNLALKGAIRTSMTNTIESKKAEFPEDFMRVRKFYVNQDTIDSDAKGTTSVSYTRQITAEVYDGEVGGYVNPKQADNHLFDTSVICEAFAQKDQLYMEKKREDANMKEVLSNLVFSMA